MAARPLVKRDTLHEPCHAKTGLKRLNIVIIPKELASQAFFWYETNFRIVQVYVVIVYKNKANTFGIFLMG